MDHFDPALISVVMPCYNAALFVEEAIESVLQQRYPSIELIIVDDGSTDASTRIIARLAAAHPDRITVLHQTNSGPYTARNHGLDHAHGNFIAFLDADDTWHPDALQQLHAAMTDTLADVAYCGWQNVGEAAADTQPYIPPDYVESDAAALFLQSCPWPINGVLVRRQLIDRLRGFSERLPTAMDYDLWLRMLPTQPTVVRVPQVLAFYRRYPRGDAHIPRWRQVFDAVAVRETFVRHHPTQVAHLGRETRDALVYGSLLPEAYRCHWRRDTDSSRRLFRHAFRKADWKARDAKYIFASFLPAPLFDSLIRLVDNRRSARNHI
ncbi:MAG TPA: glycosyltransferase [Thiobacillus sp.]|nr:MAG: glycosyl transferase family 2 [Hydrogenophilales bacterium 16-61-112]OZA46952.1 MAG: glycosyl transferase family 2 [Hydrogenophilales bacterium 17-61-76]HQT30370.1 glycosyltransferase [Thiobacillus sp.]HQT69018.1 glycosyltransferase [Thiobacillus sp.]